METAPGTWHYRPKMFRNVVSGFGHRAAFAWAAHLLADNLRAEQLPGNDSLNVEESVHRILSERRLDR